MADKDSHPRLDATYAIIYEALRKAGMEINDTNCRTALTKYGANLAESPVVSTDLIMTLFAISFEVDRLTRLLDARK